MSKETLRRGFRENRRAITAGFLVVVVISLFAFLFILPFSGATASPLVSLTPTPPPLGAIQGTKFDDLDGDGVKDGGEPGVSGLTICISGVGCVSTAFDGSYSFGSLTPATYTVFESLPSARINTTPTSLNVTVGSGQTVAGINFGNRVITPPPSDITVISSGGTTTNDTPTHSRGTNLVIQKTITDCTQGVFTAQATMTWPNGTVRIEDMDDKGNDVWLAVFSPFFPPGTATLRVDVDCKPNTPGYPENPSNISSEDLIEIGNIVFLDPSGTILNACTGQPLDGATARLLKEDSGGNFVTPSTADHLPQENPLTTGADGTYAWVVVPGTYKVRAEATGFVTAESAAVVVPPAATGLDIELTLVGGCPLPPTEIGLDIKPGSDPNSINLKSKGTIPVAILSTAGFDATTLVNKSSLTFGKTGDEQSLNKCTGDEDVNGDNLPDVVCHFNTQDAGFQEGDTEGILKGVTTGGSPIEGSDSVKVVPGSTKGKK